MKLADIIMYQVGEPLARVEEALRDELTQAAPEVVSILRHLMESGGKRIRPIMTILSARMFTNEVQPAIPVATAAELIHMATLVHDDVIDIADTRRGRPTVNALWGNQTAVLAGDALLARALVMLVDTGQPAVVRIMSEMIKQMCEGEIVQNATLRNVTQSESDYLDRIEKKTALFFAACCRAGALVGGGSVEDAQAMWEYGRLVGLAFQVADDLLDVSGEAAVVGKPVGNDLASGVLTLPVIHAMQNPQYGDAIRTRIVAGPLAPDDIQGVLDMVRANGALDYTRKVAESLAERARQVLPAGRSSDNVRELLADIAALVVNRAF